MTRFVIGVDEVGRGPIAGPVTVCALLIPRKNLHLIKEARDSKSISAKRREELAKGFLGLKKAGKLDYRIASVGAEIIDRKGIVPAVRLCIKRTLARLDVDPGHVEVLLDGSLYAPGQFKQKTIKGGDRKEPIIAAASIMAKVHRDKKMTRLAKLFPEYGFDIHKGYGTAAHYKAIKKRGKCNLHRKTYC